MLKKIIEKVNNYDHPKVLLLSHVSPDYDALSSTLVVANYLKKMCPHAEMYPVLEKEKLNKIKLKNHLKIYQYEEVKEFDFDFCIVCDVNEESRVYGFSLFNKTLYQNRFLFDHHSGNRSELMIPNGHLKKEDFASSTTEVLFKDFLKDNLEMDFETRFNLYIGMVSDTCCFTRGVSEVAKQIIDYNLLDLDSLEREFVMQQFSCLSDEEKKFLDEIHFDSINSTENLKIFKIEDSNIEDNIASFINAQVEKKISADPEGVSVLIIVCNSNIYLKFRKGHECDYDIVKLAMDLGGGGHEYRSAVTLKNIDYEQIVTKIKLLFSNRNKMRIR